MFINKDLVDLIKSQNLDLQEALFFSFAIEYQEFGLLDTVINSDIINPDTEPLYRINLCNHDIEKGQYKLKIPLFKSSNENDGFLKFLMHLSARDIGTRGHVNNQANYAIFTNDEDTKENYYRLVDSIKSFAGEFDALKLADRTAEYYKTVDMPVKLNKFLSTLAFTSYIGNEPKDTLI